MVPPPVHKMDAFVSLPLKNVSPLYRMTDKCYKVENKVKYGSPTYKYLLTLHVQKLNYDYERLNS